MTVDVLGRLSKVEELNWNQSVYSTTNYSYNARDQITQINQAGLLRTFNYDGHGRLWQRITPEQGTTSYTYNADDTVNTVTDARGASSTFTYNNRHLLTAINYGVPAGVAATSNVTYGYDSVGNRTSMTDGLGSVSYVYNTLSQMTSETRTFNALGSSYTLSYSYGLGGQLLSITNPWGSQAAYSYDKAGRVTGVTGAGQASVPTYASNLQYRAFGALKAMTYGNSAQLGLQYDNRMRLKKWDIPNLVGGGYGYEYNYSILGDNSYRVSYAKNLYDSTLNRSYDYDHLGRLEVAHSGAEADAHVGLGSWGLQNGPYSHHYGYDQYGNLNARAGWGGTNPSYTATFTNNRLPNIQFDASGNMTDAGGGWVFQYDATGQQTLSAINGQYMYYDGDRLRGKKTVGNATTYYLRSSVLGGQVIAEIGGGGGWSRGYVYLGSQLLALQQNGVYWMHQDPVTKGERVTNSSRGIESAIELDPWGGEVVSRMTNSSFQNRWYTTYEMDENGSYEAMHRRYNRWWSRFEQPDPYDGSYNLTDPQSFNRYSYTQNDPVNFTDPTGLMQCVDAWCSWGGWGGGGFNFNERGRTGQAIITGRAEYEPWTYSWGWYESRPDGVDIFHNYLVERIQYTSFFGSYGTQQTQVDTRPTVENAKKAQERERKNNYNDCVSKAKSWREESINQATEEMLSSAIGLGGLVGTIWEVKKAKNLAGAALKAGKGFGKGVAFDFAVAYAEFLGKGIATEQGYRMLLDNCKRMWG
jgi:RHS repeat-associated protein